RLPWLLHAGGLLTLAFELSFPVLVLFRRTRMLAAGVGVAFHLFTQLVFLIPFWGLWACYVVLLDSPRWHRVPPEPSPRPPRAAPRVRTPHAARSARRSRALLPGVALGRPRAPRRSAAAPRAAPRRRPRRRRLTRTATCMLGA